MPWLIVDSKLVHSDQLFTTVDEALTHIIDQRLSAVAHAILREAPATFRNGHPIAIRTLTDLIGYSNPTYVRNALLELVGYGFVTTIPRGRRGGRRYVGVFTFMWSTPVKRLMSSPEIHIA